ncbi:DEAD/DEAH box helicase [Actinacidiphila glaucinigra]|uniref:DEAD/DEAH box helicase n=1 Tax=Actinacidiphila glaucinigra TaxID=235986 RepID=UPI0035DDF526
MKQAPTRTRKIPAPYQKAAINAGLHAVRYGGRGTIVSACGTGKTLMACRICEELAKSRHALRRLVLVPTLDLLVQTVDAYQADSARLGDVYAVCSPVAALTERGIQTTTDAGVLASWLNGSSHYTVFATYASLVDTDAQKGAVITAHNNGAIPTWDLIICDEAHRTSGSLDKAWAVVHDDDYIPAKRRLYFTATPRIWSTDPIYAEGLDVAGTTGPYLAASMDSEETFGPTVFRMMLSEAIALGLARDYRVVMVEVDHPTLHSALRRTRAATADDVLAQLSLATAVLKTCAVHDLKKLITFHKEIKDCEAFIARLIETADTLTDQRVDTPDGPRPLRPDGLWARAIHQGTPDRHLMLEDFGGDLVQAALKVLANSKLLGEGYNAPTVDGLVFASPKGSVTDVVQALGRAVRLHPTSTDKATLIVPIYLAPGEEATDLLQTDAYRPLYEILLALKSHDLRIADRLPTTDLTSATGTGEPDTEPGEATPTGGGASGTGESADEEVAALLPSQPAGPPPFGPQVPELPEVVGFDGRQITPAELAKVLHLRVMNPAGVTEKWRDMALVAMDFFNEHKHLAITPEQAKALNSDPHRVSLDAWLSSQRTAYRRGELHPWQIKTLESWGMQWDPRKDNDEVFITHAEQFAAQHGGLNVAKPYVTADGFPFGERMSNHRSRLAGGNPNEWVVAELNRIDPHWAPAWDYTWQRYCQLARLRHSKGEPLTQSGDGRAYRTWLRKPGTNLYPEQLEQLQELGLATVV